MADEFTRTWQGEATRYEFDETGDELFDRMDRIEEDINPGRRLNEGEWEGLLRRDIIHECDALAGPTEEADIYVDYIGSQARMKAECIVFEK